MNETNIRKYANLMKELDLTGLEIKEDNCVVRLERAACAQHIISSTPTANTAVAEKSEDQAYISVCSPMVGVFYAAPAEDAEPFVKANDFVKKGSTLCIIEAMKLMNEITAESDGTIIEVCVKNGQVVDFGCELFRMKR